MKKPTKKPTQTRSQALFDSIIESATRILPAFGYAKATTNKIATRAGVSIGSLYQYFPDKDAIFANVLERELKKQFDEVVLLIEREGDRPLSETIDFLVNRFFTIYISQKKLLSRELFLNAAKIGQIGEILYVRNRLIDLLAQLLVTKNHVQPELAKQKVFIGLNAFMGVIQTCSLLDELPMPLEEIKSQTAGMLKSYLN